MHTTLYYEWRDNGAIIDAIQRRIANNSPIGSWKAQISTHHVDAGKHAEPSVPLIAANKPESESESRREIREEESLDLNEIWIHGRRSLRLGAIQTLNWLPAEDATMHTRLCFDRWLKKLIKPERFLDHRVCLWLQPAANQSGRVQVEVLAFRFAFPVKKIGKFRNPNRSSPRQFARND